MIIDLRNRFNRCFKYMNWWPNDVFLPEDELEAIQMPPHGRRSNKVRPDPRLRGGISLVGVLNESLGLDIRSELIEELAPPGSTYLDFLIRLSKVVPPDYAARLDEAFSKPLALPEGCYAKLNYVWESREISRRPNFWYAKLRWHQALRSPEWKTKWPNELGLAEKRQRVARMLVKDFFWLDEAFLPDDQLAALLLGSQGRWGFSRSVRKLNRELGANLTRDEVAAGRLTMMDLLKLMA